MQNVWFFFDDSGTLHANAPCPFFVYAGYVFLEQAHLDAARRKYRALVKQLKVELNRSDELKACSLTNKYRNKLYKVMRDEQSVSVTVDIERLYDRILSNKKSIVRYKDYVLKRLVKHKIAEMLRAQVLDKAQDITIHIAIDEQLTASNGFYNLSESIKEELQHGIFNHDYDTLHPPLFASEVTVKVRYCESKTNYLIQASDILANRIYCSYRDDNEELRNIPAHVSLTMP